jgi:hypothetical protein
MPAYWKTYRKNEEGGGSLTHIEGIGDSHTLCGFDIAGDDLVHRKPPECIKRPARLTCPDCNQIIDIVQRHLALAVPKRTAKKP